MLKLLSLVSILVINCHAFPRYHRLRREADAALKYGPCKNTYDQCPEWKGQGMCTSDQYKDYMMTVCPVTCEFCRESEGGESVDSSINSPTEESTQATALSPSPAQYSPTEGTSTSPEQSTEQSINTASSTENAQQVSSDTATQADQQQAANVNEEQTAESQQTKTVELTPILLTPEAAKASPETPQTSPETVQASPEAAQASPESQQTQQSDSRENVGSSNVNTNTVQSNAEAGNDEYQQMLKRYYENVEKQQADYQKSIAQSYPGYQNPSPNSPTVSRSESATNTGSAATAPAASAPTTAKNSAPTTSAQTAPLPSPTSSQQAPSSSATLPNNVPNPIAAATGQNTPIIINSAETEPYNPSKTSSALYKEDKKSDKKVTSENSESVAKGNSTITDTDEATNEKVKSESKHIEQTIKSAKAKRINAEKQLTEKKLKKLVTDDESVHEKPTKLTENRNDKSSSDENDDDEDDEDQDEDIQGYDSSKRTNLTAPVVEAAPIVDNPPVAESAHVIDATPSSGKMLLNSTDSGADAKSDIVSGSGSGSAVTDDIDDDGEGSENESGSGDMGQYEDDLHELDMLMSLNYEDFDDSSEPLEDNQILNVQHNNPVLDLKKKITRDQITVPDDISDEVAEDVAEDENIIADSTTGGSDEDNQSENNASGSGASGSVASGSGASGSGNAESGTSETEEGAQDKKEVAHKKKQEQDVASTKNQITNTPSKESAEDTAEANKDEAESNSSGSGSSGQSESEPEDEESPVDEEGSARDEEALPIQNPHEKLQQKLKDAQKGSISLVLRQNFQNSYKNTKTPSYQMLSGNVKKDFEKVLKHAKVRDISFSEANIEGNPRQTGKTRVTFSMDSNDHDVMQALTKLVDSGNINGLSVVSGSLEFDE